MVKATDTLVHNKSHMFSLERTEDVSGVSGVGVVADGIIFPGGVCALRWRTAGGSTGIYDSIEDLEKIHGHDGRTKIVYPYRSPLPEEECKCLEDVTVKTESGYRCSSCCKLRNKKEEQCTCSVHDGLKYRRYDCPVHNPQPEDEIEPVNIEDLVENMQVICGTINQLVAAVNQLKKGK